MKRIWSENELHEHWSVSSEDQALLARKTSRGQLGFALLLKAFELETRFPRALHDLPPAVLEYLAQQLGTPPETLQTYDWHGHTGRNHRQAIREWLGFRTPAADDAARLVAWLRQDILPTDPTEAYVLDVALTWYREQGIELPASAFLRRLLRSTLRTHETEFCAQFAAQLAPTLAQALDALLEPAVHPQQGEASMESPGEVRSLSISSAAIRGGWASQVCSKKSVNYAPSLPSSSQRRCLRPYHHGCWRPMPCVPQRSPQAICTGALLLPARPCSRHSAGSAAK